MVIPFPVLTGCLIGLISILYYWDILFTSFTVCVHVIVGTLGIYLGVSWTLIQGKQYTPQPIPKELRHPHISMVLQNMMEARNAGKPGPKKVVISRNMDQSLQDIIDLLLRDFILTWYKDLSIDHDTLLTHIEGDLWILIENISVTLSKIDSVKFITQDVVNLLRVHFQNIRTASRKGSSDTSDKKFILHSWLRSEEEELNYLRKVSEVLLITFLPKCYAKSPPIRHLFREVVANTVLKTSIDLLCDPDYINMTLLSYIEYRAKLSEDTRITYTYAATYEDFIKMIEKYHDIEHLKQMRFNIMTEIMQATTINNLKKSNITGGNKGERRQSTAKGELLKQRNLKKYINQLTVAKAKCEKRIHKLGGPDYKYYTEEGDDSGKPTIALPGQTVLSYTTIMGSAVGREYFESYLQREGNESLIGFWNAVENMKEAEKKQLHHLATDIYQRFISSSTSVVKVDKTVVKGMETFMTGDSGPESFYEAQQQVSKVLESQHYPSFLVSDLYHRYITLIEDQGGEVTSTSGKDELFFEPKEGWSDEDTENEMFSVQSYHAKQRLQQLETKIMNKSQALDALRLSGKTKKDSKMEKVQQEIESEVEGMKDEKRRLEDHILRTEKWCENVGKWRAHVYEAIMTSEGDKKVPLFVLVIHLSGTASQNLQSSTQGWVVTRKLTDFYTVHDKLVQIAGSWLKNKELPKVGRFTTVDTKFLKDAKASLNEYLKTIMKDERLADSEALYGFLTPTPEYFQQPGQEKKSGFFLKNIFKSLPSIGQDNRENEEELLFTSEDKIEDKNKDSIAEPLYSLINEVYELHGMFKWLRKSFIAFVEVTFGRSINRQLRETVYWIFSESMIIYYIRNFKDSMWPNGQLAESPPERSEEEKLRTRLKAKEKFLQIQPDAVKNLVGEENTKRGTIKMFEILQDVRLNKQLFYVLLTLLLRHLIPEIDEMLKEQTTDDEDSDAPLIISSDTHTPTELYFK
ncbi:sorting nexin 25 [Mactra antiquata]